MYFVTNPQEKNMSHSLLVENRFNARPRHIHLPVEIFESVRSLSKHQMPLHRLLCQRKAVLTKPEVLQQPSCVESRFNNPVILHHPIAKSFNCVLSDLIGFSQLSFSLFSMLFTQNNLVFIDRSYALRLVLKDKFGSLA